MRAPNDDVITYDQQVSEMLGDRCAALFCHASHLEGDRFCAEHREEFDAEEAG